MNNSRVENESISLIEGTKIIRTASIFLIAGLGIRIILGIIDFYIPLLGFLGMLTITPVAPGFIILLFGMKKIASDNSAEIQTKFNFSFAILLAALIISFLPIVFYILYILIWYSKFSYTLYSLLTIILAILYFVYYYTLVS